VTRFEVVGLRVRRAQHEDVAAIARVLAAVAEEGLLATEPPVDLEARAERFCKGIEGEGGDGAWVLEEDGRVVGEAGVHASEAQSVLSLGMPSAPQARGAGRRAARCSRACAETITSGSAR
jgi:N-acetylglutamate synthase-like GNAT family acetyltransferase